MNFQSSRIALWGIALWRAISAQLNIWFRSFITMQKSTQRLQESVLFFVFLFVFFNSCNQKKTLSFTQSLKKPWPNMKGKVPTHSSAVFWFYKMPRLLVTRPSSAQKPWPKKGKIRNRTEHGKKRIVLVECRHVFIRYFHNIILKQHQMKLGGKLNVEMIFFCPKDSFFYIPKIRRR